MTLSRVPWSQSRKLGLSKCATSLIPPEIFEETSHPILHCAERFSKGDLKSKKGRHSFSKHSFSKYVPHKDSCHSTMLACNQLCIYAAVCDWFRRCNRNQEAHHREGPELSTGDLTLVSKGADACGGSERRVHVQVERPKS